MDDQEAQDMMMQAVAFFAEQAAEEEGIDPEDEAQRLANNVTSGFWTVYNAWEPREEDEEDPEEG